MIRLENLSKSFRLPGGRKTVISGLTLTIPSGRSLALLGGNGAGKSTLLKLISGTLRPDSGQVVSDGSISWPVGLRGCFHGDLTGVENVRFVARIYGADTDELVDFVGGFADLGEYYHAPLRKYSAGMRARLAFGTSMGIRFDTYLVDEVTAVGDRAFKRKSRALFADRMQSSGAIMVNHSMRDLRLYCDSGLVLDNGRARCFDTLEDAIADYRAMQRREGRRP